MKENFIIAVMQQLKELELEPNWSALRCNSNCLEMHFAMPFGVTVSKEAAIDTR